MEKCGLNKNYKNNIRSNNEFYVDDVINQNIKMVLEVENYMLGNTI